MKSRFFYGEELNLFLKINGNIPDSSGNFIIS